MKQPCLINSKGKLEDHYFTVTNGIISKYLSTQQGRTALAASMMVPIKNCRSYSGIAQQAFPIQQMPQGAALIYDRDIDVASIILETEFKPDNLLITSRGKLMEKQTYNAYNMQAAVLKAKMEIMAQEDAEIFRILDAIDKCL
jgi:hypothetical protein